MNDRIRELATQAGYKPLPGFDFANSLEEIYLKKFAELIINECAELAREWEDDYVVEDTAPFHCDTKITKHFGVE